MISKYLNVSLLFFSVVLSIYAHAFSIGPVTVNIEPGEFLLTRTVFNDSSVPKVYHVEAVKISTPKANGEEMPLVKGELLYSPKKIFLQPNGNANIKFYYKGKEDDVERYYRVTFTELPTALSIKDNSNGASIDVVTAIQTILVVRPRKIIFDYALDQNNGFIKNTGNTYFEFMVKQGCEQSDSIADGKFLLPGELYQNKKIKDVENQSFIVYQNEIITVSNVCK
ncbi:molecular chaperone [Aeromonas sp. A5]|uniref:molecular chaperone n=1 Tax=unclassified Aeromonas TaxID=257493 RepID=UPI00376FAE77